MTGVLRLLALSIPLGLLLSACGPFTYVSRVTFGASGEVAQARVNNGEKMSPYEYTAATEYLQQAKELAGYARFHDANNFARKAREMAKKSKEVASRREKNDEQPIFIPDGSMYITREGTVKKGRPSDPRQEVDDEKPPLPGEGGKSPGNDDERPPLKGDLQ